MAAAMRGGILGELDPGDVEIAFGFLQEETIGASELEQPAAVAMFANEPDGAGKFAAQDPLGAEVIPITVGMTAREIIVGIIPCRVEIATLGSALQAVRP